MSLPNPDQAVIDIVKLRDYCLNPDHRRGQHKARLFAAVLGLTRQHADLLRESLLTAACTQPAIITRRDSFGQRYQLDFLLTGPNGQQALVRSGWIVRQGENYPRFVTCYVLES